MTKTKYNRTNEEEKSGKTFPIMDLLPIGKENAISTADLLRKSGCSSTRDLQQCIAYERSQGAIICSGSGKGYWRPKNRKEIEDFCRTMDARARNIFAATKGARAALRQMDQQQAYTEGIENEG